MILVALVLLVGAVAGLGATHHGQAPVPTVVWLLGGGISLALAAANLAVLLGHPAARRSWLAGTYFELDEKPGRISWTDFGPHWAREVTIDERTVKIVARSCFGLVPVWTSERPVSDFYRVALTMSSGRSGRGRRGWRRGWGTGNTGLDLAVGIADTLLEGSRQDPDYSSDPDDSSFGTTYTLALVDRHANEHTILSLSDGPFSDDAEQIVGRVRAHLGERFGIDRTMLGSPLKKAVTVGGPSGPGEDAPAGPHKPEMACPNCHRRFPLYVKSCPGCKVALFAD